MHARRTILIVLAIVAGIVIVGLVAVLLYRNLRTAGVTLSESDNGRTVTVATGETVRITLHSTYWTFAPSNATNVLELVGQPRFAPAATTVPGTGAGTVEVDYRVVQAGKATVAASRTTCGEALACTPEQRSFMVTIDAGTR